MKLLGIMILAVGVAISAAYGARLTPQMHALKVADGQVKFAGQRHASAFEHYCKARSSAKLSAAEGCGARPRKSPLTGTRADIDGTETLAARLEDYREKSLSLPRPVSRARSAWLAAAESHLQAKRARAERAVPNPDTRIRSWLGHSGVPFGAGLILVIAGATLGRIGARRESEASASSNQSGGAEDFGSLLQALHSRLASILEHMQAEPNPGEEQLQEAKQKLEELLVNRFEPLIDTRAQVQTRLGMTTYAEVYGPLSGAERKTNRAWAALVDGYWQEATTSLHAAVSELTRATSLFENSASASHVSYGTISASS